MKLLRPNKKSGVDWSDADYISYYKSRCTITESGCWEWTGFCHGFRNQKPEQRGYPESSYRGKKCRLNRKMLEIKLGRTLTKEERGCHRCDNPPCINPDHLFAGTQEHNKLDEVAKGRSYYLARTHCPKGHPYDEKNTYVSLGKKGRPRRGCKACSRERGRQQWRDNAEHMRQRSRRYRALRKQSSPQQQESGHDKA
jgi:hypothetical protein